MRTLSLDALAALVPDGALLALPPDNSLAPCALARALARAGKRNLRLLGVPVSGYAADLLIGAGCVASVETSAVTLGEAGTAPRFIAALVAGRIRVTDATCPAIHTMLQAAEKGVPFLPLRGIIGSDILEHRPDWKMIDNPFAAATDPSSCCRRSRPTSPLSTRRWRTRRAMSGSAGGANSRRWRTPRRRCS